jgi:hypothetical protein
MLPIAATVVTSEFCLNERGDATVLAYELLGVLPKISCTVEKTEVDFSLILPPPIHFL